MSWLWYSFISLAVVCVVGPLLDRHATPQLRQDTVQVEQQVKAVWTRFFALGWVTQFTYSAIGVLCIALSAYIYRCLAAHTDTLSAIISTLNFSLLFLLLAITFAWAVVTSTLCCAFAPQL